MENNTVPGKGKAIASLVLGIVAIVFWWFGYSSIVSVVCGIIGIILAISAKKDGFNSPLRTVGFILSLIGLIGGAIFFIACAACAAAVSTDAGLNALQDAFQ